MFSGYITRTNNKAERGLLKDQTGKMKLIAFAVLITLAYCQPPKRERRQLPFFGGGGGGGQGGVASQAAQGLFNAPQSFANTATKAAGLGQSPFKVPGVGDLTSTTLDLSSIPGGNSDALFNGFQSQLKKTYATAEETLLRKDIFKGNNDLIQGFASAVSGFTLKLNWLADLATDEFNQLLNGYGKSRKGGDKFKAAANPSSLPTSPAGLPKSVDWRKEGAVTEVQNQKQCAGCFAFSAAGAIEGYHFRKTGQLVELSQQNLIDCTNNDEYENLGCSGGFVDSSFQYVKKLGVTKITDYPYESNVGDCRFKTGSSVANVTGFEIIPSGNEKALAAAVANKGPVSVAIYASLKTFQFYDKGVYEDKECKNTVNDVNHAVLVVGYGEESDGKKYWIVKNSYGPDWGDKGYIKIAKDKGNHCGIATAAFYPI